jgi:hypothetical protein
MNTRSHTQTSVARMQQQQQQHPRTRLRSWKYGQLTRASLSATSTAVVESAWMASDTSSFRRGLEPGGRRGLRSGRT